MSENTEVQSPSPGSFKTRIGKSLVRAAIGGNHEKGLDFSSVRIIGRHLKEIDSQIPDKGLPLAIKEHFQKLGYNIEAHYLADESKKALEEGPALVVATHPNLMDPVNLIGSFPDARKDISIVGNIVFQSLGNNFGRHVIPIYRSGNDYRVEGKALLWRKYGILQEKHTFFEAGKLNNQSLADASQKINEGGLVVFLPDGPTEGKEWYPGVGELIKRIKRDDAQIVFATTEKPRMRDYARISATIAGHLPPTTTKVSFSEPHLVSEFAQDSTNRHEITQNLRQSYDDFAKLTV